MVTDTVLSRGREYMKQDGTGGKAEQRLDLIWSLALSDSTRKLRIVPQRGIKYRNPGWRVAFLNPMIDSWSGVRVV